MEVRLLGRFDVVADGNPVALGGPRQRAVLAVLAIHANEIISTDRLAEEVWAGELPATAVVTMQRYISLLRRALHGLPATIETARPGYLLKIDPDCIDARRFERQVAEGRARLAVGDANAAAGVLRDALSLWRGDPLADFAYEEFARIEIGRLEELRTAALELRIEADLALGRHRDLIPELEALVSGAPLQESHRGQLMRALHRAGRRGDALRVYQEGRRAMAQELGLDPCAELQALEREILLSDCPAVPAASVDAEPARPAQAQSPAQAHTEAQASSEARRLPAELTSFVGRSQEVDEVGRILEASRLVTLTGVGGSGKSRLALRIASSRASELPQGALLVELGGLTDPAVVPQAVANAVGVRGDPERPVADVLVDTLRAQECLLVLDCCEHLLDAVAGLVQRLLAETEGVRIIVTSREILDVPGEAVFRVPTLSIPEAAQRVEQLADLCAFDGVRLFVERAKAVDAGFRPTDEDAAVIAELCRRLDGLPLALELAAARTDVLTLRQLAERLDDRFELLTGGWRTAPPRQRTLKATIAWSYDLLDEVERTLFERLSVFAGSFTFEGAEAVCAGNGIDRPAVFHLLSSLARKSLVVRVHSTAAAARYRLLDTVREFAGERLRDRPGDLEHTLARHAAHFVDMAERAAPFLRGAGAADVMARLDVEHEEFRAVLARRLFAGDAEAACRLAAALAHFWDFRYHVRDGYLWLQRVLEAADAAGLGPSRALLWSTVHAAYFAHRMNDSAAAVHYCDEAERMLAAVPDDVAELRILCNRGEVARYGNDQAQAEACISRAAELASRIDDDYYAGDAFRLLALSRSDRGDTAGSAAAAEECMRRFQACGDPEKTAGAHILVGFLALSQGDYARAEELGRRSEEGLRRLDEPLGHIFALSLIAHAAVARGDTEAAERGGRECLEIAARLEFIRGLGIGAHILAEAALERGDIDEARQWITASVRHYEEFGFAYDLLVALPTSIRIHTAAGNLDAAARDCDALLRCARTRQTPPEIGRALRARAELLLGHGDVEGARRDACDALGICRQAGDGRGAATALVTLAAVAVQTGHAAEARRRLDEAVAALAAVNGGFHLLERREFDSVAAAVQLADAALVGAG